MSRHEGSCHCGAVRFVYEGELENLATCNCSMCGRTGAVMVFVPTDKVQMSGQDQMTDYQFGKKSIHHAFCKVCGVRPYAWGEGHDGAAWAMVNVRCVDGVDSHALTITNRYDGKSL